MVHHGVDLSSNRYIWRCEPRKAFQKDATDGPKDAIDAFVKYNWYFRYPTRPPLPQRRIITGWRDLL